MKEKAAGFLKLGMGCIVIWLLIAYICPAIVEAIPAYRAYGHEIDSRNMTTSALFYNDVEQAGEGELHIRNALRFPTRNSVPEKQ